MKKILIMEDDKKLSLAWAVRLRSAGYDVLTCHDGFRGFMSAVVKEPDLILMDIWMPIANGFAVAEDLKKVDLGGIPIIFTTASKKKGLWKRAQEAGGAGFLEKPVTSQKLLEAIAGTLGRSKGAANDGLEGIQKTVAGKAVLLPIDIGSKNQNQSTGSVSATL